MAVTRTFDFNPVWATPGVFSPGAGGVDSLSIAKYANGNLLIPFVDSTFVKYVGINAGTTITSGRISNDPPVFELFFDPESTVLLNGNIVTAFSMANSAVMFQITGPTILPASPVNEFSPVREDTTVTATGTVEKPTVAALSDGGFVVTWGRTDGADRSIFARRYNLDGNAIGGISESVQSTIANTVLPQNLSGSASRPAVWSNRPRTRDSSWSEKIVCPGYNFSLIRLPFGSFFLVCVLILSGVCCCLS